MEPSSRVSKEFEPPRRIDSSTASPTQNRPLKASMSAPPSPPSIVYSKYFSSAEKASVFPPVSENNGKRLSTNVQYRILTQSQGGAEKEEPDAPSHANSPSPSALFNGRLFVRPRVMVLALMGVDLPLIFETEHAGCDYVKR